MRTTVVLADDVRAAVDRLCRERSIGVSESVNELVRRGIAPGAGRRRFDQRTHRMGLRIDVTDVADAGEALDAPARG